MGRVGLFGRLACGVLQAWTAGRIGVLGAAGGSACVGGDGGDDDGPILMAARTDTGLRRVAGEESGQGTTEYAILVGVLVLIAIVAVMGFRDRLQELWTAITDGINSL